MSKKKTPPWCLVIDCSIGHAASDSPLSDSIAALHCAEFLAIVRNEGYQMAWSNAIEHEWERHQSTFAVQWLASMMSLKKLRRLAVAESKDLRERVEELCIDAAVIPIVLKDCHLIEAALATDSRIASTDDNARGHFTGLAQNIEMLRAILWVNLAKKGERAIAWLEAGAPAQKKRCLHV